MAAQNKYAWLLMALISSASCQPARIESQKEVNIQYIPDFQLEELMRQGKTMIRMILDSQDQDQEKDNLDTLGILSRQGKMLMSGVLGSEDETVDNELTGRQAATFATSLGALIRPAITALIGSLTMNLATSATNAVTAAIGGRALDLITADTFAAAPAGRLIPVEQTFSEYLEVPLQKKRPPKRRQRRHPSSAALYYEQ